MENVYCQILTGIYPTARAINEYHMKRKEIRKKMRDMSGVSEYSAKNLFWRKHRRMEEVQQHFYRINSPPFVYELEREIAEIQRSFLNNADNIQFVNAAKYKKKKNDLKRLTKILLLRYGFNTSNPYVCSNA